MAEKKTVSAREVVADIRVGMSDEQLMLKHGLSAKGLESLKTKLVTAGLLTAQELDGKSPPTQVADPSVDKRAFAKNMADAVKDGLPDAEIIKRFGISAAKLPKVYESLVKAGYLSQEDLNRRGNGEGFEQSVDLAPDVMDTVPKPGSSQAAPVTATETTKDVLRDFAQRFNIPREELERLKTASIKDIKAFFEKHNIPWSEGMELVKALGLRAGDFAAEAAGKLKDKAKGIFSKFGASGKEESAANSDPAASPESSNSDLQGAPPNDPPKQSRSVTKCPNCRMPQNKPFEICPQCGIMVEKFLQRVEGESGAKKSASNSRIKTIAIAAGVILVVVALIGGLKSMIGGKKSGTAAQTVTTANGQETGVAQNQKPITTPANRGSAMPVGQMQDVPTASVIDIYDEYVNDYAMNHVNADRKWRGKRIHLKDCMIYSNSVNRASEGFLITVYKTNSVHAVVLVPLALEKNVAQLDVSSGLTLEATCEGRTDQGIVVFSNGKVVQERFNDACLALAEASVETMDGCFKRFDHYDPNLDKCLTAFAKEYVQRDSRLCCRTAAFALKMMAHRISDPVAARTELLRNCENSLKQRQKCEDCK